MEGLEDMTSPEPVKVVPSYLWGGTEQTPSPGREGLPW